MYNYLHQLTNGDNEMSIEELIGKTLINVESTDDEIIFTVSDTEAYRLCHYQDCCEDVHIESIVGDLSDLIGAPIITAIESCDDNHDDCPDDSCTWTFYKFSTTKGYVDIRWIGSSNGYYSESVYFDRMQ